MRADNLLYVKKYLTKNLYNFCVFARIKLIKKLNKYKFESNVFEIATYSKIFTLY